MTAIVVAAVLAYIGASVLIGVYAHRRSQDSSEDYFVAQRSLSWVHLGLTLFATWMSTFAFLGSPGFYYKKGVTWFLPHAFLVVGSPLLMWFIGRKVWLLGRRHGYITPADLLADFYESNAVRYLVATVSLLALVPYCLIQLIGIGKVLCASTNGVIPYWFGVAVAVAGIAVYTYMGGVRAIVWTDALQAVLFGLMMLVGAGVALYAAGGLRQGYAVAVQTRPEAFVFDQKTIGSPLTLLVIWTFGYVLLPHMWQRAYMAKSAEAFSKSVVMGATLALVLIALPSLIMGTLGIGFMGGLTDSDNFVPSLYATYFSPALPFLVLATFAAGMSTIDSQLLSASSVVVRDVAQPILGGTLSSRTERVVGRCVVLFLVALLVVLALMPGGRGNIIMLASKGTGIALLLLVPLCGPLIWPAASRVGAVTALVVGGLTLCILEAKLLPIKPPYGFGAPVVAAVLQAPFFVVASLLFPRGGETVATADATDTCT